MEILYLEFMDENYFSELFAFIASDLLFNVPDYALNLCLSSPGRTLYACMHLRAS